MKISQFNKVLYKGNINRDFYLFCVKKDKKLWKYLFINLWYVILSYLFYDKRDIYKIKKYNYLKDVNNLNKMVKEFYKKVEFNSYFNISPDIVVDKVPKCFMKFKSRKIKVIGYEFDDNYDVKLDKFNNDLASIKVI